MKITQLGIGKTARIVAILLAILTVAYLLPFGVFGEAIAKHDLAKSAESTVPTTAEAQATEHTASSANEKEHNPFRMEEEKEADAVAEDTARRESNIKHFLMDDGSYTMIAYTDAVHYKDENGQWQDIDNSLSDAGSEYETGDTKIKFAKKVTGNETLFSLHHPGKKLEISLIGAAKKTAGEITNHVTEHGENATKLQKMTTLDNLNSNIIYRDILPDTDIEYLLRGASVKENIIVKAPSSEYIYTFRLSLNGMAAVLTDNEISLKDGDETVYVIPAPYMLDASGARSDSVSYALADNGNGKYTLTVTADAEWINAEGRVFPVTVDPTVELQTEVAVEIETARVSYSPSNEEQPYAKAFNLLGAGFSEPDYSTNGYIAIKNLNIFTRPTYITGAYLSLKQEGFLWCSSNTNIPENTYMGVNLTPCYAWTKEDIQWYNQPSKYSYPISQLFYPSDNGSYSGWNITEPLRGAIGGGSLYLCMQSSNLYYGESETCSVYFYNENSLYPPTLTVRYKDLIGIEDYWSYTEHSAGFAGSGAINNRTGSLVLSLDTLAAKDGLFSAGINLVYNGVYAGQPVTSECSALPHSAPLAGNGFKLSLQQALTRISIGGNGYFIYTDGDGTEHWLKPTDNEHIYADISGRGLILDTSQSSQGKYTITDKQGNKYNFHEHSTFAGYKAVLESITDATGNRLKFMGENDVRPTTVTVTPRNGNEIQQLQLIYNQNGLIKQIYDPHTAEAYVFLYSETYDDMLCSQEGSGYLRQMLYVDGKSSKEVAEETGQFDAGLVDLSTMDLITMNYRPGSLALLASAVYHYNSAGQLISAIDNLNDRSINYTYDTSYKVSLISERTGTKYNETIYSGQKIGFTYSMNITRVRSSGTDDVYGNSDDIITNYVFDTSGRPETVYTTNAQGNTLYGAEAASYVDENEKAKNRLESYLSSAGSHPNLLKNGALIGSEAYLSEHWSTRGAVQFYPSDYSFNDGYVLLMDGYDGGNISAMDQSVQLTSGSYTLTVRYRTTDHYYSQLLAQLTNSSGVTVVSEAIPTTDQSEYDDIHDYSITFEVGTSGTYTLSILIDQPILSCCAYIYSLMLVKDISPHDLSYIEDGHFTNGASGWETDGIGVSVAGNDTLLGSSVKVGGVAGYTKAYTKVIDLSELPNATAPSAFTLSGWAKKNDLILRQSEFRMGVRLTYASGEETEHYYDFSQDVNNWQFGVMSFAPDPDKGRLVKLTVSLEYNAPNTVTPAYFDDVSLIANGNNSTDYSYSEAGDLIYTRTGNKKIYYAYNSNSDILFSADNTGAAQMYFYEDSAFPRRLTSAISYSYDGVYEQTESSDSDGLIRRITGSEFKAESYTEYTYNSYSIVTSTKQYSIGEAVSGINYPSLGISVKYRTDHDQVDAACDENYRPTTVGAKYLSSSSVYETTSYSRIFGVLLQETSYSGTSRYYYNETSGRLITAVDSRNNGYFYTYDALGNVTNITPVFYDTAELLYTPVHSGARYTYDHLNRLAAIHTSGATYRFTYDEYGNTAEITVGNDTHASNTLASYSYNENNGKLNTVTYGNGHKVRYIYDQLDRLSEVQYNTNVGTENETFVTAYSYTYDKYGNVVEMGETRNKYNILGNPTETTTHNNGGNVTVLLTYDSIERLSRTVTEIGESEFGSYAIREISQEYTYGANSQLKSVVTTFDAYNDLENVMSPTYDALGRTTQKSSAISVWGTAKLTVDQTYSYAEKTTGETSGLVSETTTSVTAAGSNTPLRSETYQYTYDANGNITEIKDGNSNSLYRYYYDTQNQLIREDNIPLNKTYVYTYDDSGNILSKKLHSLTDKYSTPTAATQTNSYVYSTENGRLISFNGETITYDEIGNPLNYRGGMVMTWEKGRQLQGIEIDVGFTTFNYIYTYNSTGTRISKMGEEINVQYVLNGTQVARQTINGEYIVDYIYHEDGTPLAFAIYDIYDDNSYTYYFYETNMLGDIVGICNENGQRVISFTYDAWGNFTAQWSYYPENSNIFLEAILYRYRGYIYDSETGFYLTGTRYYDPEIGRFINADSVIAGVGGSIQGYNMFAYCFNNPVNMSDPSGNWPKWIETAANWVNKNIIQPVANFFSPSTNTISGQFQDGILRGSGSLTGGYSEINGRLQVNSKDSKNNGMLGGFAKVSTGNASGKIGIGNNNAALSLKGVGDGLTATAQAGIQYKNGAGLAVKAKAAVLSGRATTELELFGWQIEFGVSGDLLSVGAEAMIGVFPNEGFTAKANVGAGLFGAGFVFRVKPAQ